MEKFLENKCFKKMGKFFKLMAEGKWGKKLVKCLLVSWRLVICKIWEATGMLYESVQTNSPDLFYGCVNSEIFAFTDFEIRSNCGNSVVFKGILSTGNFHVPFFIAPMHARFILPAWNSLFPILINVLT